MKKVFKRLIISFTILFGIYNIIWLVYVQYRYYPFIKALGDNTYWEDDGYVYYIKTPDYLSFVGNLSIDEYKTGRDIYNETTVGILIWPQIDGGYTVAAQVQTTAIADYSARSVCSTMYSIMLNDDMTPDLSTEANANSYYEYQTIYEDNWEKIEAVLEKARIRWHINI